MSQRWVSPARYPLPAQWTAFEFCQDGGKIVVSGMTRMNNLKTKLGADAGKRREQTQEFLSIQNALTSPTSKTDLCMSFLAFSHTSHRAMCRTRSQVMRRRESIGGASKPLHKSPDEEDTRCNDTRPTCADSSRSFVISTVSTSTWSVNIHEGGGSQNQHELEKMWVGASSTQSRQ